MIDPGLIITIIERTKQVIDYLAEVYDAPTQKNQLLSKIVKSLVYLSQLRDLLHDGQSKGEYKKLMEQMEYDQGYLEDFSNTANEIKEKLEYAQHEDSESKNDILKHFGHKAKATYIRFHWPIDKKELQPLLDKLDDLNKRIDSYLISGNMALSKDILREVISIQDNFDRHEMFQWLSPIDFEGAHERAKAERTEGTGAWFLNSQEFLSWKAGESRYLWCHGMSGVGKTLLMSTVIDELRTDTDSGTVVLYLYLSSKDDRLQKYRNLIGCLIHQLAKHAPSQASEVAELWKKRIDLSKTASELSASQSQASDGAASTSSSKEHRKAFSKDENDGLPSYAAAMAEVNAKPILAGDAVIRKILRTFSRAYVVVDALNELADGEDQHRRLLNLLFDLPDNTRVILTSTQEPEKDNSDKFRMCSIKANAEDLDLYATNRLQLRRDLSPDQIDKIILPAIRDRSKGLFLLAKLHVDTLMSEKQLDEILQHLDRLLPTDDQGAYDGILDKLYRENAVEYNLALKAFSWIFCAQRSLTLTELRWGLAMQLNSSLPGEHELYTESELLRLCRGLVESRKGYLMFFHQTFEVYMRKNIDKRSPEARTEISLACIRYFDSTAVSRRLRGDIDEWDARQRKNPLLEYASVHWGHHLLQAEQPEEVLQKAIDLVHNTNKLHIATHYLTLKGGNAFRKDETSSTIPLQGFGVLHTLAYFGLDRTLEKYLDSYPEKLDSKDEKDERGMTPFLVAAKAGHVPVVRFLGSKNVDMNATDNKQRTALVLAVENGRLDMVKDLVGRLKVKNLASALEIAVSRSQTEVTRYLIGVIDPDFWTKDIKGSDIANQAILTSLNTIFETILLETDIDIEQKYSSLQRTLLMSAAERGNLYAAKLLIDEGASLESRDVPAQQTALFWASWWNQPAMVQYLLERGAQINIFNDLGETPLGVASICKHKWVVHKLLDWKEPPILNSGGRFGRTPLSWWAGTGDAHICDRLISLGADINSRDNDRRTPLWWACNDGRLECVTVLLQQKSDIDAVDNAGESPLCVASRQKRARVVHELLKDEKHLPHLNQRGIAGRDPLSWWAGIGDASVCERLLSIGAQVDTKDNEQRTPLWWACFDGNFDCVKAILKHNPDVNAKDAFDESPLCTASRRNRRDCTWELLRQDPRPDINIVPKGHRRTPLSWWAGIGDAAICRELVAAGADVNSRSHDERTPLWWACFDGWPECVEALLKKADTEMRSSDGDTPLIIAVKRGRVKVVKLLLEDGRADVNARDREGRLPLWWARQNRHDEIANLLVPKTDAEARRQMEEQQKAR